MLWKILRPRFWILDRAVRKHRTLVLGVILVLGFGGQWVYSNLIAERLALLASDQALAVIASALPAGLFVLLMFAVLGVGDVMHQLYQATDLELLMVAPIPYRTVFLVKLLQGSRATWMPALGLGAVLVVFGVARGASPIYYPLVLLTILAAMSLTTALVITLVVLLARLLPPQRMRAWIPAAIALVSFGLMVMQQSATRWFSQHTAWIAFLTAALLHPGRLALVSAGLAVLALGGSAVAYGIFRASYHEGWNRFRQVPLRRESRGRDAGRPRNVPRLIRWLPAPLRAILVKEWLELRRNPRALVGLAQPLVVVAIVLLPVLTGGGSSGTLRPLLFWLLFALLTMYLGVLPLGTSMMAVAQEGPSIALLRSTPASMSDLLKAKFWATWLPAAGAWVLVVSAAALWLRFPVWQVGILAALTLWGSAGTSTATVAIAGLTTDFAAEELRHRPATWATYATMGLNIIFALLTAAVLVWLVVQWFPDSTAVLPIRALAGSPTVGWLFSQELWGPSILLAGQIVFWLAIWVLWGASARRLERWEVLR